MNAAGCADMPAPDKRDHRNVRILVNPARKPHSDKRTDQNLAGLRRTGSLVKGGSSPVSRTTTHDANQDRCGTYTVFRLTN